MNVINVKELQEQREALVRTIQDFVDYREQDDPDTEFLSRLLEVVDQLIVSQPQSSGAIHDE